MSNFSFKAKHIATGKIVEVEALDDYYGRHEYGYRVGETVWAADEFDNFYKEINPN